MLLESNHRWSALCALLLSSGAASAACVEPAAPVAALAQASIADPLPARFWVGHVDLFSGALLLPLPLGLALDPSDDGAPAWVPVGSDVVFQRAPELADSPTGYELVTRAPLERHAFDPSGQPIGRGGPYRQLTITSAGYRAYFVGRGARDFWEFSRDGRLAASVEDGLATRFAYDSFDHLIEVRDPSGTETSLDYDGQRLAALTQSDGRRFQFRYDASGDLDAVTGPGGSLFELDRDDVGRVVDYRVPSGGTGEEITYAESGAVRSSVVGPDEIEQVYEFGPGRASVTVGGVTTSYLFEGSGSRRVVASVSDGSTSSEFSYDGNGQLLASTNLDHATGAITLTEHLRDPLTGLTTGMLVDGQPAFTRTFNAWGQMTSQTADGVTTFEQYDAEGKPVSIHDSNGDMVTLAYDDLGSFIGLTVNGQTAELVESAFEQPPAGETPTLYTYDTSGPGQQVIFTTTISNVAEFEVTTERTVVQLFDGLP